MSFLIASKVPYRPSQCPDCELLSGGKSISDSRCHGFAVQDQFGGLLAEFSGESSQPCPKYKPKSGLQELEEFARSVKRMNYTTREFVRMGADEPNKDKAAICYFRAEDIGTDDIILGETIRANLEYCARKESDTVFLRQLYDSVNADQNALSAAEYQEEDKVKDTRAMKERIVSSGLVIFSLVALIVGALSGRAYTALYYRYNAPWADRQPEFLGQFLLAFAIAGLIFFILRLALSRVIRKRLTLLSFPIPPLLALVTFVVSGWLTRYANESGWGSGIRVTKLTDTRSFAEILSDNIQSLWRNEPLYLLASSLIAAGLIIQWFLAWRQPKEA